MKKNLNKKKEFKKELDSETACNEKYLKTKIRILFYNGKINKNFHNNK